MTKKAEKRRRTIPIALLTADLHLQPCPWADRRRVTGDSYWAFRQIVDLAVKHDVPNIFAAGDLLDTKRHDTTIPRDVQQLMNELEEKEVHLHYVQGDHDRLDTPWLSLLVPHNEFVHHYAPQDVPVFDSGVRVQFIDWQPPDMLQMVLQQIKRDTDVVVMHQTLDDLTGGLFVGEMAAAQVPHAKMLVIGDIHRASIGEYIGASGQTIQVVSPGTTNKQAIDETDKPTVVLLSRDADTCKLVTEQLPLQCRATLRYTVYEEQDVERLLAEIPKDIEAAIARMHKLGAPESIADYPLVAIEIDETELTHWRRLSRAVAGKAELFQQVRGAVYRPTSGDTSVPDAMSLPSALRLEIVQKGVPAAVKQKVTADDERELMLNMWNSESPAKALRDALAADGL